jgi:arylformamidase
MYDLTLPVHEAMLLYPGDPAPRIRRLAAIAQGAPLTTSAFEMTCHAGTHVDAPAHFLDGGRRLSDYEAAAFTGPAAVLDLASHRHVTREALAAHALPPGRHLLLRTRNSALLHRREFEAGHAVLTADAARHLLTAAPLSVGFDYCSVDGPEGGLAAHRLLAEAGLLVYVCLDLAGVPAGSYRFYGLPLRLDDVEAAPVRAILVP